MWDSLRDCAKDWKLTIFNLNGSVHGFRITSHFT